ncbi:hypothetical protein HDU96_010946 [Phlyctochytrium bullatum]|nr:hypothetical protein HDU96_010946 [Phlyctochytrium bullatum]
MTLKKISPTAYGFRARLPNTGTITVTVSQGNRVIGKNGYRGISVTMINNTGTKIGARFYGPNVFNYVNGTDYIHRNFEQAFDVDPGQRRHNLLDQMCFCQVQLFRAGFLGFMDVVDGGIFTTPQLREAVVIDEFNEVVIVWDE